MRLFVIFTLSFLYMYTDGLMLDLRLTKLYKCTLDVVLTCDEQRQGDRGVPLRIRR